MTQSTAPPRAVTLRNFSRRPRVPSTPPTQRLHDVDIVWMAVLAFVSVLVSFFTGGPAVLVQPQTYLGAVIVLVLYLLGFRVRDRSTAVIATALLASSPLFSATQIESVRDSLFVLFTISALAASAAAQYTTAVELLAVVLAAVATIMRPEGFLLGAVLMAFSIVDKRPGGVVGIIMYLVVTLAGIAGMVVYAHVHFPTATVSLNFSPFLSLVNTQTVVLSFFIIALLGDLADPGRRARWKTVIVWAVLFLCVESLFHFSGFSFEAGPFRPVLFLLAAGGISRILPVVAGDFPNPKLRYGIAVLFVGLLVGTRVYAEWPQAKRQLAAYEAQLKAKQSTLAAATKPHAAKKPVARPHPRTMVASKPAAPKPIADKPAPSTAATVAKPVQVAKATPSTALLVHAPAPKKQVPHHYVYVPGSALKPKPLPHVPGVPPSLVAAAVAAGVPLYASHHGRTVARMPWSIKWDVDHKPKPIVAAKAPAKPAAALKPALKPAAKVAAVVKPAPKPVVKVAAKASIKPVKPVAKPAVRVAKAPARHLATPIAGLQRAPVKPVVRKSVVARAPANSLAAQAAAAGVPMYHIVRGRQVPRNVWAIKWDIAHAPKHVAVKAAVKPARAAVKPHAVSKPAARPAHVAVAHPIVRPRGGVRTVRPAPRAAHRVLRGPRRLAGYPVRRPRPLPRKRHRSIWAIRWQRAHPRRR